MKTVFLNAGCNGNGFDAARKVQGKLDVTRKGSRLFREGELYEPL
jgi:hypothetical protein